MLLYLDQINVVVYPSIHNIRWVLVWMCITKIKPKKSIQNGSFGLTKANVYHFPTADWLCGWLAGGRFSSAPLLIHYKYPWIVRFYVYMIFFKFPLPLCTSWLNHLINQPESNRNSTWIRLYTVDEREWIRSFCCCCCCCYWALWTANIFLCTYNTAISTS